jgi:hypothetical protein
MIAIRSDQMNAFEKEAMDKFVARAIAHLRRSLAELTKGQSDEALGLRVRSSVERARSYGLTTEQEVIAFLDTSFLLGDESFDSNPAHAWAAELLIDDEYTPREKAALLLDSSFDIYDGRSA